MKPISAILLLQLVVLRLFVPTQATGTGLKFNGKNVSANLKDMPLKDVLSELEKERGIQWEAYSDVTNKKISMQIKDEYIEDAIKQILSKMNYALLFDASGKMTRILIFGQNGDSPNGLQSRPRSSSIISPISRG